MKQHSAEELLAGEIFRNSLIPRADAVNHDAPLWHGWALMTAFLAGIDWARKHDAGKSRARSQALARSRRRAKRKRPA